MSSADLQSALEEAQQKQQELASDMNLSKEQQKILEEAQQKQQELLQSMQ